MSVAFALLLAAISMPCGAIWALIGASARQLLRSDRALRTFNILMAMLLIASLIPMVLSP
jgi:threonine/homoserine/homoserine lactone efflux protein